MVCYRVAGGGEQALFGVPMAIPVPLLIEPPQIRPTVSIYKLLLQYNELLLPICDISFSTFPVESITSCLFRYFSIYSLRLFKYSLT